MKSFPDYYYFPPWYQPTSGPRIHGSNSGLAQNSNKHRLLYSYPHMPDIYEKQILLDLDRTFSDLPEFCIENDPNKRILLNILLSYTKRNSMIGYCQGMNYLAATFLRVFGDEELAFWGMCYLCESVLSLDYYSHMIEVLIDQKVFVHLLQELKPKLYEHLQSLGLDVALVLFQWFICLFASQFNQEVTEAIWDMILLEGTVAIFKSSLAIFELMEEEILASSEFADIYPVLNNKPFEVVNKASIIMKGYKSFLDLKEEKIIALREEYRPIILEEQKKITNFDTPKSKTRKEPISTRRVKFLAKFPLLDFFLRNNLSEEMERLEEIKLDLNDYKCSKNPICLFDFTFRAKTCNFLLYRVAGPVGVYEDYFTHKDQKKTTLKDPERYILISDSPQEIPDFESEYNKITDKMIRKRSIEERNSEYNDDDLLICRESHLCTKGDFYNEFESLFNTNCESLLHHQKIFHFEGDEKSCEIVKKEIAKEIINNGEVNKIEKDHSKNKKRRFAVVKQEPQEGPITGELSQSPSKRDQFDIDAFKEEIENTDEQDEWSIIDEKLCTFIKKGQKISSDSENSSVQRTSEFNLLSALRARDGENSLRHTFGLMHSVFEEPNS